MFKFDAAVSSAVPTGRRTRRALLQGTPPESRPDFADEWVRKVMAYRKTLTRANPDVLVMVGSDHFHQLQS